MSLRPRIESVLPSRRQRSQRHPQEIESTQIDLTEDRALPVLESGEIIGGYRLPWGSNYTFLVYIDAGENQHIRAIYKPRDGERPSRGAGEGLRGGGPQTLRRGKAALSPLRQVDQP